MDVRWAATAFICAWNLLDIRKKLLCGVHLNKLKTFNTDRKQRDTDSYYEQEGGGRRAKHRLNQKGSSNNSQHVAAGAAAAAASVSPGQQ